MQQSERCPGWRNPGRGAATGLVAMLLAAGAVMPSRASPPLCYCPQYSSERAEIEANIEFASAIFAGQVTAIDEPTDGEYRACTRVLMPNLCGDSYITVRVEAAWKGVSSPTFRAFTHLQSSACRFDVDVGRSYLMYAVATEHDPVPWVHSCSRSRPLSEAGADRTLLGEPVYRGGGGGSQSWKQADLSVRRLAPESFPRVPVTILEELARRGCLIPQEHFNEDPHNVLHGEFIAPREHSWAVLCSVERTSSILVFSGPPWRVEAALAEGPDEGYLQDFAEHGIVFSRVLSKASPSTLRRYAARPGYAYPSVDHDGIEDAFAGKASSVYYFDGKRWLKLAGAD